MNQKTSIEKNRWLFYALAVVIFLFFVNDNAEVSVDKVSIVVGIGVDKGKENNYEVSAEIVLPQSEKSKSSEENTVLTADGDTVGKALANLFLTTGWTPKLNYCNLIVVSKELAEQNIMEVLQYFIAEEQIMDSALVTVSENSAKSVLESMSPLDKVTAFSITRIVDQQSVAFSNVTKIMLKDFVKNYFDGEKSSIVPIATPMDINVAQSKSGTQNTLLDKYQLIDMTSSALFSGDKMVDVVDKYSTRAYNFLTKDVKNSIISIDNVEINGNKTADYTLEITDIKQDLVYDMQDVPKLNANIDITVKLYDSEERRTLISMNDGDLVPYEVIESAEMQITQQINRLITLSQNSNSDILGIGQHMHKYHVKKWKTYLSELDNVDDYYKSCEIYINVNVKPKIQK